MNCKVCILLIFSYFTASSQSITSELKANWQFRKEADGQWMKASVPGTVHTDLLQNKKIPDPFYRDNEVKLQWIENESWEYHAEFDIDQKTFNRQNIELVFNGLDTYAEVYLNDELIVKADNMFRTWRADVKRLLRSRNNQLYVRFAPAQKKADSMAQAALPYQLPGDARVYVRKAQYHFGSDWSPKLTTCGIWRKVELAGWDDVKIEDVYVKDFVIDSMYRNDQLVTFAQVETEITINSRTDKIYNLALSEAVGTLPGRSADPATREYANNKNFVELLERIYVKKGTNRYTVVFGIRNPELWWCRGLGSQKLYQLKCELFDAADMHAEAKEQLVSSFALRKIELVREVDSKTEFASVISSAGRAEGKSFYFRVNGIPVFIKGANYIPQRPFLPLVVPSDYQLLVENAKAANINLLRVTGSGVYEDEHFYRLCDENGILVWQDFMFAAAVYPGDRAFLENVREELQQNIIRLRNHPSIALWCGNNENDEAWQQGNWQVHYNIAPRDSMKVHNAYQEIFHRLAPEIAKTYDGGRNYLPATPGSRWQTRAALLLDEDFNHGLWHRNSQGYDIETAIPNSVRFVSAYGLPSLPAWSTIESFTKPEDRDTSTAVMKVHQKIPAGKLGSYIQQYFNQPKDFESYAYLSQCLQAYALKNMVETQRSSIPYCMGIVYAQLNDCGPLASWSSIDVNGKWKASHFALRNAYRETLIVIRRENGRYTVSATNDNRQAQAKLLKIVLADFEGRVFWQKSIELKKIPWGTTGLFSIDSMELFKDIAPARAYMQCTILEPGGEPHRANIFYFARPKDQQLEKPRFSIRQSDATHIDITADILARYVWIDIPGIEHHLDENFFDLLPGETVRVEVKAGRPLKNLMKNIKVRSLADTYNITAAAALE